MEYKDIIGLILMVASLGFISYISFDFFGYWIAVTISVCFVLISIFMIRKTFRKKINNRLEE